VSRLEDLLRREAAVEVSRLLPRWEAAVEVRGHCQSVKAAVEV
jgi:hypothetical protein